MPSFVRILSDLAAEAFIAEGHEASFGAVTPSSRPDLGQFQCNGALAAAKRARANPRALGEAVAARLRQAPIIAEASIAGPGFINLTLSDAAIADHLNSVAGDARLGVALKEPESIVLDFGGPNIAKPMHVGHLRSAIIGDSLQRLFRFAGDRVISDVHMGDWGLPMGMLIDAIAREQPDLPYFDPAWAEDYPETSPVTLKDLERLYPQAAAACKADPQRLAAAREATRALQEGRPGYRALWDHFMTVSVEAMRRDFASLGVRFDLWKGEADVDGRIGPMLEDLRARGLAEESDGALVLRVALPDDKYDPPMPPLILQKADGAAMYGTTDLATILDRVETHQPDAILYVVDQRQHLHFEQVFRAARRASYAKGTRLEHLGFGTVNGPDGRPFKTREGGVMPLGDLIRMAEQKAAERMAEAELAHDQEAEEREATARAVGIAAVKFADLANHRTASYVFDLDRFTRFEGKTGPYLQYAIVRIRSILRRAAAQGDAPGALLPPGEAERDLMLMLGRLPDVIAAACEKRAPNELCDLAFALAQSFSAFYAATHILSEPDAARRASWLGLAKLALDQLVLLLDLLGIEAPERM